MTPRADHTEPSDYDQLAKDTHILLPPDLRSDSPSLFSHATHGAALVISILYYPSGGRTNTEREHHNNYETHI